MSPIRVGIIGYGNLGKFLIKNLNLIRNEFVVVRVWNRTISSGEEADDVQGLEKLTPESLCDIDLVVEVAHPKIISDYGEMILEHADLFIGSPTGLANQQLLDRLHHLSLAHQRKVLIPAGAFWGGVDIQKMANNGSLKALTITMIKHPSSFKLSSPLFEKNEAAKLKTSDDEPTILYEGSVRQLCPLAPNNVNTMAGGAIAAHNLGFDNVKAKLVADPKMIDWHIVEVKIEGDDGFEVTTIRKNPAKPGAVTGQLTYLSFLSSIKESRYKPIGIQLC